MNEEFLKLRHIYGIGRGIRVLPPTPTGLPERTVGNEFLLHQRKLPLPPLPTTTEGDSYLELGWSDTDLTIQQLLDDEDDWC